jgi:hypothetical protein
VNDAALSAPAPEFSWAASGDETVLQAARQARDGSVRDWPAVLYAPYRVETAAGPIAMGVPGPCALGSHRIHLRELESNDAARDFVEQVRAAGISVGRRHARRSFR